jgi:CheY-like chemotaxis protein
MTGLEIGDVLRSLAILVVDDHEDVRDAFAEVLRGEGFQVATASNGQEALSYLCEQGASMVFLDLKMPVVDGISFIQLVRSSARTHPWLEEVPIVVVTAASPRLLPPDIRIVRKPCPFDRLIELARTAQTALDQGRASRPLRARS